jgi:type I restriction enzyme S subunit
LVSPAYVVVRPRSEIEPRYFSYLFRTDIYKKEVDGFSRGIVKDRNRLYWEDFKRIPSCFPSLAEQKIIADYLDVNAVKVRRFIRNRRRLIEVLNEQKQAIINRAVTRGLNPAAALKPSGIDWLGDIPAEWEVLRGKYLFREVDTRSQDGKETHLSMSQKFGLVPASQLNERHFLSSSYAGGKLVHKGDIVLNRLKAHLGVFQLAWQDGVISPDYTVFRPLHNHSAQYFELVLRSSAIRPELSCRVKGLVEGFWRLYTDDFYNIQLPVPPAKEQLRIVESCQVETVELDAAIRVAQREINHIREYRTRLISDVVTGKIDVRHLAPQAGSEDLEDMAETLEPLEHVIDDVEMDEEENVHESD